MFWTFENEVFNFFCKFMIDEAEIIFLQTEAKRSKLFKSKPRLRKHFGIWFWSFLKVKNKWYKRLKMDFSPLCTLLSDEVETDFLAKWGKDFKPF